MQKPDAHVAAPVVGGGASEATRLQQEREAAYLQNHRQRLIWLSTGQPKWACGTPVDSFMRHELLRQSRVAVELAA